MNQIKARIGNFTSSEIYKLIKRDRSGKGFGAPALDYIDEKNMARRLGRSLTTDCNARPLVWGNLLEPIAFRPLPFGYELKSKTTIVHPDYDFWSGSPDGTSPGSVFDIKCPITLKSFCQFVDSEGIEAIRAEHSDGEKYYWQLVSNAILTGSDQAELIVFMPYLTDLPEIRLIADNDDAPEGKWIYYAKDHELPYLIEGGHYNSVNIIRFDVPQSDKDLLTESVKMAGDKLIKRS